MKKTIVALLLGLSFGSFTGSVFASVEAPKPAQTARERAIDAVVRNKMYYKADRIEVGITAGTMPFDSIVNHYLLGGRLNWHLSDTLGWEVVDAQFVIPSVTSYTINLAKDQGISSLQTTQLKLLVGSNFLLSPLYGKIRFFGHSVLYFDVYVVAGLGLAKTDTLQFSSTGVGVAATQTTLHSGFDPMFNLGFGFKVFLNRAMGLVVDIRDCVTYSSTYGKKSLGSNFAVALGLTLFLPTF